MSYILPAFIFIFGLIVGSFLNVCILRLPENKSIIFPPSHCPLCKKQINFYDNIPILSFIVLRGKCRWCNAPISLQYPLTEFLSGLLFLALFLEFGLGYNLPVYCFLGASLLVVSFIDLKHQIIPDLITLPGIIIGLLLALFFPGRIDWLDSLLGIFLGGGLLFLVATGYYLFAGEEGMGGGDIKLLAMIGSFLGWQAILFTIFAASFLGSAAGLSLMIAKKKDKKYPVPFGPFLSLGAIIYIFCGHRVIAWYLGLV